MSLRAILLLALGLGCAGCGPAANPGGNWAAVQAEPAAAAEANGQKAPAPVARHIITKASFTAETGDLEQLSRDLTSQLAQLRGYVAGFNEQRFAGNRRSGVWTIRVPANQFEPFVAWLDKNATVLGKEVSTQDVSEEYVDLAARLTNKKNTEQRLTKVLEDRTGKLEDILTVEREIDRVREEIERIEGRLRFLEDRVAMCTVTLTVTTRLDYQVAQAPSFLTRVRETWWSSLEGLRELGEGLALCFIALLPWLPVLAALGYIGYRAVRFLARRLRQMVQSRVIQPPIVHPAP